MKIVQPYILTAKNTYINVDNLFERLPLMRGIHCQFKGETVDLKIGFSIKKIAEDFFYTAQSSTTRSYIINFIASHCSTTLLHNMSVVGNIV